MFCFFLTTFGRSAEGVVNDVSEPFSFFFLKQLFFFFFLFTFAIFLLLLLVLKREPYWQ